VHGLLASGLGALNELFPQFTEDLDRSGAVQLRAGLDVRIERPGYDPFPQRDLGWVSRAMSRPLVELTAFFEGAQSLIETPWAVANLDFIFPPTRGQRPADLENTVKFGIALECVGGTRNIAKDKGASECR
jgi:hypothetical protein